MLKQMLATCNSIVSSITSLLHVSDNPIYNIKLILYLLSVFSEPSFLSILVECAFFRFLGLDLGCEDDFSMQIKEYNPLSPKNYSNAQVNINMH